MLNSDYRDAAARDLEKADAAYKAVFQKAVTDMERLHHSRLMAIRTIQYMERYIVALANRPRDFDRQLGEIRVRYVTFQNTCSQLREAERRSQETAVGMGAAGVLGGAGIAALGPTAAMSVAMTFGTASTGTAIASLSGAAATNAALAWLGGGALVAGGGGIMAGQTLLTLAGPVGCVLSGVSLAGCLLAVNLSNREIARRTEESLAAIKKEMERIKEIDAQVLCWNKETKALSNAVMNRLSHIRANRKRNYTDFTDGEMNELASLFNSTEVLSRKIGETMKQ